LTALDVKRPTKLSDPNTDDIMGKAAKDRPKKKRRLVAEEPVVVNGVPMLVWRHKRKWYIGWEQQDDGKVWFEGRELRPN
jgi:hypothetical protein